MRFLRVSLLILAAVLVLPTFTAAGQEFEDAVIDVGNVGLTITNAGFVGRSNVRNNPTGPPSFEFPLNSGVEHIFEGGLWIGARRADGIFTVRTAAQTSGGGYTPGASGYEFAQSTGISARSTLPESDAFSSRAISHLDYISTMVDTATTLPGTQIAMPDPQGRLGILVEATSYAWNFPFTESFVILNYDIINISEEAWDSVYVGLYHDLVVRNVNTTQETGGAFFNKGGLGFDDEYQTSYAFNAGGPEETINTYGAVSFLGAEWRDPATGQNRFFHPKLAAEYEADGYTAPEVIPRWWGFSGQSAELDRPNTDVDKFTRMSTKYPNPNLYAGEDDPAYLAAVDAWYERLKTDGQTALGNWIGLTPVGPFATVLPGDTLTVTFAMVTGLKPDEFQGQGGKAVDTEASRAPLLANLEWARRTYAGEDNNFNGVLDADEDVNGNGQLDRYLIPEPPRSPKFRAELSAGQVDLYWDKTAEESIDPVTGEMDFEGYRIYRSNPGDGLGGDIVGSAKIIGQFDSPGNRTGFNNGFEEVALDSPITFEGDTTQYWYKLTSTGLLSGWQYVFAVTAFDTGDPDVELESFESSKTANSIRVFPGTPAAELSTEDDPEPGVYPNPYRVNAAWDGGTSRTRKIYFYNLPAQCEIRVYTLAGEIVASFDHDAATYQGDTRWFDNFGGENRLLAGGEHAWDILSDNSLNLASGLYFFSVKNTDTGDTKTGKFVIIK